MTRMIRNSMVLALFALCAPIAANAASAINWDMEPFEPELQNKPSLQNGFKLLRIKLRQAHAKASTNGRLTEKAPPQERRRRKICLRSKRR